MIRPAIVLGLLVGLAGIAYAHGDDKDKDHASDERASKSSAPKSDANPKSAKPLTANEIQVMNSLHAANQTEVAAGKLAEKNTTTASVLRYGRMLVKDHTAADRKLSSLAAKRALTLSSAPPTDLSAISGKQGADFDSAFAAMMVKDHGDAIALVERGIQTCEDRDLHAMLEQLLPALRRHQSEAMKLQQQARAQ